MATYIKIVPIKLRLIKYTISETTYTLGTTLLDRNKYKGEEFSDLYHSRWGVEELYKISKVLIDVEDFHSQTERGVKRSRETWFGKIAHLFDRTTINEETWDELEELLIAADVGVATTQKLIERVKKRAKEERLNEGSQVRTALKREMVNLLNVDVGVGNVSDLASPRLILVVGVNGSGKTTSIAKLAHGFKNDGEKVILAAADTFRAAAIDQIKHWGAQVGVDVVAHQPLHPGAMKAIHHRCVKCIHPVGGV